MPFSITCPSCDSRLTVPDALAGKRVKCKKCDEPFVARRPGGDDEEDEAPPARSKASKPAARPRREEDDEDEPPRKASRRPADDEDDEDEAPRKKPAKAARRPADDEDEDEDERPSRKRDEEDEDDAEEPRPKGKKGKKGKGKKGKKKAGSPVLLFVLIGVGALLLLSGGGVGVYYAFFKEDKKGDTPVAKGGPGPGSIPAPGPGPKAGPPAVDTSAWVEVNEPAGRYRAKFPAAPQAMNQQAGPVQMKIHMLTVEATKEMFGSLHAPLPDPAQRKGVTDDQLLDQMSEMAKGQARGGTVSSTKPITYQGFAGREMVMNAPKGEKGLVVFRLLIAGNRTIMLMAGGETATADSPRIKAFFETLKIE